MDANSAEDLAPMEQNLRWVAVGRMLMMLCVPLLIALFFDSIFVKIACWLVAVCLLWSLVSGWGDCVFAIAVVLVPLYIYFELSNPPKWLAYVIGVLAVFEFTYIRRRIKLVGQQNSFGSGAGEFDEEYDE